MKRNILLIFTFIFFSVTGLFPMQSRKEIVDALFRSVENWMGSPYSLGGVEKDGVDCSGFVVMVYDYVFKMKLPRRVRDQKVLGTEVTGRLQPGDLLFFDTVGGVSHVGIYVFDNKFIHAASAGRRTGVIKSSLNETYYKNRYLFARRLVELPAWKKQEEEQIIRALDKQVIQGKADLVLGNRIFLGKVIASNKPVGKDGHLYFQVKSGDSRLDMINLEFQSADSRYFFAADISNRPYIGRVKLTPGEYTIRITDSNLNLLNESRISVQ